ncbi:zincin-like metallopeptidase domain-containing protein, partial [Novosphingobium sp. PS1R-30]
FYSLDGDYLQLPPRSSFSGADSFCRAICHELIHATGHISRVSRPCAASTSSVNFVREELVAELGGAFLCAMIGVNPVARHPELIGSWFALCRHDESEIFRASSQVSKAVAWILGRTNA